MPHCHDPNGCEDPNCDMFRLVSALIPPSLIRRRALNEFSAQEAEAEIRRTAQARQAEFEALGLSVETCILRVVEALEACDRAFKPDGKVPRR